jgi:surfactin synthase thioesterase subunit
MSTNRLFCFANAGGDVAMFRNWSSRLPQLHQLDEAAFREAVRQRQQIPNEVFSHSELMDLVSPFLPAARIPEAIGRELAHPAV